MFTLDLLAQIYLISFLVGGCFIVFNFLLGQIGHSASDHHGIHLSGGHDPSIEHDASIGHHASSPHQIGDNNAHSSSHDLHHLSHDSHDLSQHAHAPLAPNDSPNSQLQTFLGGLLSGNFVDRLNRRLRIFVQREDIAAYVGMLIISLFSPMRIAIWLTFFGLSGLFTYRLFPWLSLLSLIPAIIIGFASTKIFNNVVYWLTQIMQSPSNHSLDDLIGTIAEVNTPMTNNRLGEIVYMVDSVRANCAAKPIKEGMEITRGQRVMIIDMKEHIALVEPVNDSLLFEDFKR